MDIDTLRQQMHGRKFGELILEHVNKLDLQMSMLALRGITDELPITAQSLVEDWIDEINPSALSEEFWKQDCGLALMSITNAATRRLKLAGMQPTSDDIFNMFQIIVISFACTCHANRQSKAFVQKAIGIGFIGRIFG